MIKTKVIATTEYSFSDVPFKKGDMFWQLGIYFRNGEHHLKLETDDGTKFEAPAVFFDNAITKKMFKNLLLQFLDTDDGDAYDEWFEIEHMLKEMNEWMRENNQD